MSMPSRTSPKTTWRPSSQEVMTVVMKNCEPFVFLPELAMPGKRSVNGERASVRALEIVHTEKTLLGVLQLEVLIVKLGAVNGLSSSAVTLREVTTLDHEVLDDTVEGRVLVSKALLARAESSEVLGRLYHELSSVSPSSSPAHSTRPGVWMWTWTYFWCRLSIQSHDDPAQLFIALLDIEVDLVSDLGAFLSFGRLGKIGESEGQDDHKRHQDSLEGGHVDADRQS